MLASLPRNTSVIQSKGDALYFAGRDDISDPLNDATSAGTLFSVLRLAGKNARRALAVAGRKRRLGAAFRRRQIGRFGKRSSSRRFCTRAGAKRWAILGSSLTDWVSQRCSASALCTTKRCGIGVSGFIAASASIFTIRSRCIGRALEKRIPNISTCCPTARAAPIRRGMTDAKIWFRWRSATRNCGSKSWPIGKKAAPHSSRISTPAKTIRKAKASIRVRWRWMCATRQSLTGTGVSSARRRPTKRAIRVGRDSSVRYRIATRAIIWRCKTRREKPTQTPL